MRTSGAADDILMMVIPLAVLAFVALVLFGGPGPFMEAVDDSIRALLRSLF